MVDEDNEPFDINGKIENWYIYFGSCIMGNIFNDSKKRFKDDTLIKTSKVTDVIDELKEGDICHTRNSIYLLGKKVEK